MSELTDDERAVLMIAAEGQSMLAIGCWQKPVENLTFRNLLRRLDAFNYVITDAGREALKGAQQEEDADFRRVYTQLHQDQNARLQTVQSGDQAAIHLSIAAKAAAKISGNTPQQEAWSIGQGIIQRALELLK